MDPSHLLSCRLVAISRPDRHGRAHCKGVGAFDFLVATQEETNAVVSSLIFSHQSKGKLRNRWNGVFITSTDPSTGAFRQIWRLRKKSPNRLRVEFFKTEQFEDLETLGAQWHRLLGAPRQPRGGKSVILNRSHLEHHANYNNLTSGNELYYTSGMHT